MWSAPQRPSRRTPSAWGRWLAPWRAGKEADLIIVDNDPHEDIRALRSMRLVMQKGALIPPPVL